MTEVTSPLAGAIETALAAATAATDAATEMQGALTRHEALGRQLHRAQRRAMLLAAGAVAAALVSVGAAGLVYLRSVADLREAAGLQAAAATAWAARMTALDAAVAALAAPDLVRRPDLAALSATLTQEMAGTRDAMARGTPEQALGRLREDMLAALSDLDLRLSRMQAGAVVPAPAVRAVAPVPVAPPVAAPPRAAAQPAPTPRRKPQNTAAPSPFSFP